MAYNKDQKTMTHRGTHKELTSLERRVIPLGGLCKIISRSTVSSSSERETALFISEPVAFPSGAVEWIILISLPVVAEARDFTSTLSSV